MEECRRGVDYLLKRGASSTGVEDASRQCRAFNGFACCHCSLSAQSRSLNQPCPLETINSLRHLMYFYCFPLSRGTQLMQSISVKLSEVCLQLQS
jgi:hypothetical protein